MSPKKPWERAWTQPDLWLMSAVMVAVTLLYVAGVLAERAAEAGSETVLGVPVEDPSIVTAIVMSWLLLAAVVVTLGRPILPSLVLIAGAAALFDGAEVVHQLMEARYGIAVLAALVSIGHLAILVLAALALTRNGAQRIAAMIQALLHTRVARLSTVWQFVLRRDRVEP